MAPKSKQAATPVGAAAKPVAVEVSGAGLKAANGLYEISSRDGKVVYHRDASDGRWVIGQPHPLSPKSVNAWYIESPNQNKNMVYVTLNADEGKWICRSSSDAPAPTVVFHMRRTRKANGEYTSALQEQAWKKRRFTDAVVTCGDSRFDVHRSTLSAASPVFEAAFASVMKEGETAKYEVTNSDPAAVEAFLYFVYTGNLKTELADESLTQLFHLAVMYEVNEMVSEVASNLLVGLTETNVSARVRALNVHQDKAKEQWKKLLCILQEDVTLLAASLPR
eukprot:TRINITY_DN16839_c0_g1_i3.p1 TRINITY_DN16839_c0_g1~~TRINITY_DN16839_c0_g1_i3.p1  ORF type:complete len:315 (+),score=41.28 TRINITY_DN16839_c0_g1_i3:111-947(+)